VAVVVSKLIDAEPDLIDAYKDLELRAQLLGREPDLNYQQRLRQVSNQELALLQALRQPNAIAALELQLQEKDRQLKQLQEEVDLALSQLDQVQEELEHYFLLNRGLQQLIDRHEQLERRSERLLAGLIKF
jgi:multidrug resistance efflux pump